ncbi:MAG TPA: hypothetical protein VLE43_15030 [Candidatus Saccharimonadia bacterium]|nr:hypothetical protein [Candidatus Saccharimonadia bacterium]
MKRIFLTWFTVFCTAAFPQAAAAKPDLGKVWSAETIVLRLAEASAGLSDPGSDLEKKYFVTTESKSADPPKDSIRWCECVLVRQLAKVALPDDLRKESNLYWGELEWKSSKSELAAVVGLASSSIYLVGDDELENQFWIFELYGSNGELGYIGVAHDCGSGMFQYHPNTKFALLAHRDLLEKLAHLAREVPSQSAKEKK